MARFEIPEQQVLPQSRQANPNTFGAGVASALYNLGGTLSQVSKDVQAKRKKQDLLELETKINESVLELDRIETESRADHPDGSGLEETFTQRSSDLIQQTLEGVPSSVRAEAESKLNTLQTRYILRSRKDQISLKSNAISSQIISQVDEYSNQVSRGADYITRLDRIKATSETLRDINPQAADRLLESATDSILAAEFQNSLDTKGYEITAQRIDSGEFDDMNPETMRVLANRAAGKVSNDLSERIQSAKTAIRMGHYVGDLSSSINIAESLGKPKQADELRRLQEVGDSAYDFARLPFDEQKSQIDALQERGFSQGLSQNEQGELQAYSVHLNNKESMLKSDPYAYYETIGQIPVDMQEIPVLPVGGGIDVEGVQSALEERKAYQEQIIIRDNVQLPLLTNEEVAGIKAAFKNSSPTFFSDYANQLSRAFGRENLQELAKNVAPKDKDLAGYLALSYDNKDLLERILRGKDSPSKIPDNEKWQEKFAEMQYTRTGMTADVMSQVVKNAQYLSKDIKNNAPDIDDDSLMEQALNEIAPSPIKLNNGTFSAQFTDSNGNLIDPVDIEKALKLMTDEDFEALGYDSPYFDSQPIPVKNIINWVQVVPIGTSDFIMKKAGTDEFFLDDFGSPIRINMEALTTQVKFRADRERNLYHRGQRQPVTSPYSNPTAGGRAHRGLNR